jgi:hypothetical protein
MKCPKCSTQMYHSEGWEEYWDGEVEDIYWWGQWDCLVCHHTVYSYDDNYVLPEDEK